MAKPGATYKICLDGVTRAMQFKPQDQSSLSASWEEIVSTIATRFSVPADSIERISYVDKDNDDISFSTNQEVQEFYNRVQWMQVKPDSCFLRWHVHLLPPASASASTTAASLALSKSTSTDSLFSHCGDGAETESGTERPATVHRGDSAVRRVTVDRTPATPGLTGPEGDGRRGASKGDDGKNEVEDEDWSFLDQHHHRQPYAAMAAAEAALSHPSPTTAIPVAPDNSTSSTSTAPPPPVPSQQSHSQPQQQRAQLPTLFSLLESGLQHLAASVIHAPLAPATPSMASQFQFQSHASSAPSASLSPAMLIHEAHQLVQEVKQLVSTSVHAVRDEALMMRREFEVARQTATETGESSERTSDANNVAGTDDLADEAADVAAVDAPVDTTTLSSLDSATIAADEDADADWTHVEETLDGTGSNDVGSGEATIGRTDNVRQDTITDEVANEELAGILRASQDYLRSSIGTSTITATATSTSATAPVMSNSSFTFHSTSTASSPFSTINRSASTGIAQEPSSAAGNSEDALEGGHDTLGDTGVVGVEVGDALKDIKLKAVELAKQQDEISKRLLGAAAESTVKDAAVGIAFAGDSHITPKHDTSFFSRIDGVAAVPAAKAVSTTIDPTAHHSRSHASPQSTFSFSRAEGDEKRWVFHTRQPPAPTVPSDPPRVPSVSFQSRVTPAYPATPSPFVFGAGTTDHSFQPSVGRADVDAHARAHRLHYATVHQQQCHTQQQHHQHHQHHQQQHQQQHQHHFRAQPHLHSHLQAHRLNEESARRSGEQRRKVTERSLSEMGFDLKDETVAIVVDGVVAVTDGAVEHVTDEVLVAEAVDALL